MPYIPSALSVKTSITSCFCSGFHLRILLFVLTIHLIYFSMSSFCPLSSCKEIERKVNGSRIGLMSCLFSPPPSSSFHLARHENGSASIMAFTTRRSMTLLSTILRMSRMIQRWRTLMNFLTGGLGASS